MGRGKHGTDIFRGQVQAFRDLGLNNSEIARRLGCSRKKVINAINLFNDTGSLSNKKRKPRERKTISREDAAIAVIAKLNPFVGAPKIKEQIAKNLKLCLSALLKVAYANISYLEGLPEKNHWSQNVISSAV